MSSSDISLPHLGVQETRETIHKEQGLWGHTFCSYAGSDQAFLQVSQVWDWGEVLKSWYALPPHATWLVLHLSSEVSARMFLSHVSDVVSAPKYMGLEFACSLHTSVNISVSTSVQHHAGHQRDIVQPPTPGLIHQSRTQTLGRLIRSIKCNNNNTMISY